jgi:hypothetical protein
MRLAGSIKAGVLTLLLSGWLLAGCGAGSDSTGQTVSRVPVVTAPQLTAPTQPQKSAPVTSTTQGQETTAGGSTGASSQGQASRQGGGSKPAKETKAQRQKQNSCEKQVAHLPPDQQRQALADCLSPSPPAPEAPQTTPQR